MVAAGNKQSIIYKKKYVTFKNNNETYTTRNKEHIRTNFINNLNKH